jgi:hypothetical protein
MLPGFFSLQELLHAVRFYFSEVLEARIVVNCA